MSNLPRPAAAGYLIPPELERTWEALDPHEEAALWAGFDGCGSDDGLDHLDQLAASIQLLTKPAAVAEPPVLPAAEWLRAQASYLRANFESVGKLEDLEVFLARRISDLADEFERLNASTPDEFQRAERRDMARTYAHHQDIGRITGLCGESRQNVIQRIAAFE